jgi:hypothetical protein
LHEVNFIQKLNQTKPRYFYSKLTRIMTLLWVVGNFVDFFFSFNCFNVHINLWAVINFSLLVLSSFKCNCLIGSCVLYIGLSGLVTLDLFGARITDSGTTYLRCMYMPTSAYCWFCLFIWCTLTEYYFRLKYLIMICLCKLYFNI